MISVEHMTRTGSKEGRPTPESGQGLGGGPSQGASAPPRTGGAATTQNHRGMTRRKRDGARRVGPGAPTPAGCQTVPPAGGPGGAARAASPAALSRRRRPE